MIKEYFAGCKAGESSSWEKLLQELHPKAVKLAARILRDRELAQDAAQNALIKVYKHLESIRDEQAFSAWFNRVVTNEAYLALRVYQREMTCEIMELFEHQGDDPAERTAFRIEFLRAMRSLPEDFQEVVLLSDVMGLKLQEVAERCSAPVGTIKSRLFRGREMLRVRLSGFGSVKEVEQLERPKQDLINDYLEGRLNAVEQGKFAEQVKQDPELALEVAGQKKFLKLLHSMTGKLSLSAVEIAAKMKEVYETINDYSQEMEETFYTGNTPQTLLHKTWFKKPDLHRMEAVHHQLGRFITIIKGDKLFGYSDKQLKATSAAMVKELVVKYTGQDFALTLKEISTNNTTRLLGTETIEGRVCYHMLLQQTAPGHTGEITTHLWIDKMTWMPMLTEQYDADGELITRKAVHRLLLNSGVLDDLFELPAGIEVEEQAGVELKPPREVKLEELFEILPFRPYLLNTSGLVLHSCQVLEINGTAVAFLNYHQHGNPTPELTLTQSTVYHTSLPPGISTEEVVVKGEPGIYIPLEVMMVKGILSFKIREVYLNLGGNASKEQLLAWAEALHEGGE